jgi:hypothetical protein
MALRNAPSDLRNCFRDRAKEVLAAIEAAGSKERFIAADLANLEDVKRLAEAGRTLADIATPTGVNLCAVWGRALILGAIISLVASRCLLAMWR